MRKRKNISLLIAVVVFAVALFASAEVMAACDNCEVETTCTLIDARNYSPYPDAGNPYTVTALPPVPEACPDDPSRICYKWCYELNVDLTGNNQFVVLAPQCCPELGYQVSGGGQVIEPGGGDPTTDIGRGNFQVWSVRLAEEQPTRYCFYTERLTSVSNASGQFKFGRDIAYCTDIAVPNCGSNTTVTYLEVTTSNGETFCVNGDVAVDCDTGYPLPYILLTDLTLEGASINYLETPGLGPQPFIVDNASDNTTYWCSRTGRCYYRP